MFPNFQVIITCQEEDDEDVLTNEDYDKLKRVIYKNRFICHLILKHLKIVSKLLKDPQPNLLTRSQDSQSMRLSKCGTTSR